MIFNWGRKRIVKCPDGTTRIVYNNVDDAFPLHLTHTKRAIDASVKGLQQIQAGGKIVSEDKISAALAGLDKVNQSMQSHFRAVYTVFEASPCTELPYLRGAVEKIILEEQRLRSAETVIAMLCEFVSKRPKGSALEPAFVQIVDQRLSQAIALLLPASTAALAAEMADAQKRIEDWTDDE